MEMTMPSQWTRCLAAAAMLATLGACSDDGDGNGAGGSSTTATGGGGAGGATGGGGSGGDAGGGEPCASHDNVAAVVQMEMIDEDIPVATGGAIAYGTYHLVQLLRYTGPGGMTGVTGQQAQETAIWSAESLRTVLDLYDGQGERRMMMAYDLGDGAGTLALSVICPEPLSVPYNAYNADETSLALYGASTGVAFVYDKVDDH